MLPLLQIYEVKQGDEGKERCNLMTEDPPCAHIAAPILLEMLKTRPMIGMLSRSAAAKPNARECNVMIRACCLVMQSKPTSIVPPSLCYENSDLISSHFLRCEVLLCYAIVKSSVTRQIRRYVTYRLVQILRRSNCFDVSREGEADDRIQA